MSRTNIQAVFLDRDGTIGGHGGFCHPEHFTLYPWASEAINLLKVNGVKIFAFTNQHPISLGEVTEDEFVSQFQAYGFDQAYICPHPINGGCACRKPEPGMLLQAAKEHNLDLHRCAVIGDAGIDMVAANSVGATKILVRTGLGEQSLGENRITWKETIPDYVAQNVLDAVEWLLNGK